MSIEYVFLGILTGIALYYAILFTVFALRATTDILKGMKILSSISIVPKSERVRDTLIITIGICILVVSVLLNTFIN